MERMSTTPPPPLKSTTISHLRKKYMSQLEFMDRELKRLEKQLLGARTRNGQEAATSLARRERLRSFLLHLEDLMQQIELGCKLEDEGKSTLGVAFSYIGSIPGGGYTNNTNNTNSQASNDQNGTHDKNSQTLQGMCNQFATSLALTKLTKEKAEEENVQRLEEHILVNLLPVKDRLATQLAALERAPRNPVGK